MEGTLFIPATPKQQATSNKPSPFPQPSLPMFHSLPHILSATFTTIPSSSSQLCFRITASRIILHFCIHIDTRSRYFSEPTERTRRLLALLAIHTAFARSRGHRHLTTPARVPCPAPVARPMPASISTLISDDAIIAHERFDLIFARR